MFIIREDNKMILTKGDTATIKVEVFDADNKQYSIKPTDTITMKVKQSSDSQTTSITKTAENGIISILPADTSSLTSGMYVYDIQLVTNEGNVYTIVPQNFLDLKDEIS